MAAPKPPATVKVGPFIYTVTVDDAAINAESVDARTAKSGTTNPELLTILVRATMPHARVAEVIAHEVLHALLDLVALSAPAGPLDDDTEEQVVAALAPALLAALRENPALVAYLTADT